MPDALQFASPLAGLLTMGAALLVWRSGVRHYTSTGS
jgi:ABC-2 type transport system permease protein